MATKQPVSPDKPLTLKQRKFVDALPLASSATEAAIKAGYSSIGESPMVEASRTLRIAKVQAAIAEQRDKLNAPAIAEVKERKTWLSKVLRNVNLGEPIPVQAGLAASDQLNKMERLYAPETVVHNDNRTQILMGYSLEQLDALL